MKREEKAFLLDSVEGFESEADDAFATLENLAIDMAETPGVKRLATKAREAARLCEELCRALSEKSERLQEELDD